MPIIGLEKTGKRKFNHYIMPMHTYVLHNHYIYKW